MNAGTAPSPLLHYVIPAGVVLLVLFFTPAGYWQAFAFVLFRFFDVLKPPPIRSYERVFKGGWGVMIDDIVAAFFTLIVLAVARTILG